MDEPLTAAPGLADTRPPRDAQLPHEPFTSRISHTASLPPRTKTSKLPVPGATAAGPLDVVTATISSPLGAWAAPTVSPGAGTSGARGVADTWFEGADWPTALTAVTSYQ